MAVKLEPLGDRVIVSPIEKEEVSKGGYTTGNLHLFRNNRTFAELWEG